METKFDLSIWLNLDEQLEMVSPGGWIDGGCRLLAESLQNWIGSHARLRGISRDSSLHIVDHVVVEIAGHEEGLYLDGDGLASREELLQRLERDELMPAPTFVPLSMKSLVSSGITAEPDLVLELSRRLALRFGKASQWSALERKPLFHVTPSLNIESIERWGLLPALGERSVLAGEQEPLIYCFPTRLDMDTALSGWLGEEFSESVELAVVVLDWPGDRIDEGVDFEIAVREAITPNHIIHVEDELGNKARLRDAKHLFSARMRASAVTF